MITNFIRIAWRTLMKSKTFSLINILGLTIGLTSFLLIALYVFDELTFDRFHTSADNIYRIVETQTSAEGKESKIAGVPFQLTEKVKSDLPEVKNMARLVSIGRANISTAENATAFYEDYWVANPGFLTTFDFVLLKGDRLTALSVPHSVIVTEEMAKK